MKLALIQCHIDYNQVDKNKQHIGDLIEQACQGNPDVIILPEMWNTGYALTELEQSADNEGQDTVSFLSALAKKHQVNMIGGSVSTKRAEGFFNSNYVFNRDGQLISHYDKVHLFGLMQEDRYLKAGDDQSLFYVDQVKASSVICYDIRFPEWTRLLMSQGSQILFVMAQWPETRKQQWEILLKARAVENQAFVVAVNRVGDGPNDHFSGQSMVIDPLGNILVKAKDDSEDIVLVDIDLSEVSKTRGEIPVFDDRRLDLYSKENKNEL